MSYYFDTSALCQNYHREAGSTTVEALLADQSTRHVMQFIFQWPCISTKQTSPKRLYAPTPCSFKWREERGLQW